MLPKRISYERIKRALDISVSATVLLISIPLQISVATLVFFKLGKPVLFIQERPGKDEKIFKLLKFRTMLDPTPLRVSDEERLTQFGKLLRSTSLDELPSLVNVLKGDMSLVGPRPLLVEYLSLYNDEERRRHLVRPGITGLAQVNGRNNLSWKERFNLDIHYVKNYSLKMDLDIIKRTIVNVALRDGISQEGHVTMSKFEGST